jgi:hypothetical protein
LAKKVVIINTALAVRYSIKPIFMNAIQSASARAINRLLLRAGTTTFQPMLDHDTDVCHVNITIRDAFRFQVSTIAIIVREGTIRIKPIPGGKDSKVGEAYIAAFIQVGATTFVTSPDD